MPELIIAVSDYAGWLYVLLALLVLREVGVLLRSGREHDLAMFGLEREAATGRGLRALITMFLLATIGVGVYLVSAVLAPALPEQATRLVHERAPLVETPPTVMLPTDTPTPRPATATRAVPRIVTAAPETVEPAAVPTPGGLCRNPDMEIVSPVAGAVVAAGAEVVVTVRFEPASGWWFRIELGAGPEGPWRPLGPVGTAPVERAVAGRLPGDVLPGRHVLRLQLADASGRVLPGDVCEVWLSVR